MTDLDNTLFDWFEAWYSAFRAELDKLVELSGVDESVLLNEFKALHQRYGTAEYAYSLVELPSIVAKHNRADLLSFYEPAIQAYRQARDNALRVYPGVIQTLTEVKRLGALAVGYTESMPLYTTYRLAKLGLDGLLDYVYSPEDHPAPTGVDLSRFPFQRTKLGKTQLRHTPPGELKPNPHVLTSIIDEVGGSLGRTIYVGDSKMKDVAMAQRAHVIDVWAKYGLAHNDPRYNLLRDVTHWTPAQVEREKTFEPPGEPSFTLEKSFQELLDLFSFQSI